MTKNSDGGCVLSVSGLTPGEDVKIPAIMGQMPADSNGTAQWTSSGDVFGSNGGENLTVEGSESGKTIYITSSDIKAECNGDNVNGTTPTQPSTGAEQGYVAPAQDNTVTDTTADVATKTIISNNNSMIALAGSAAIAAVLALGTVLVRRKKA
ncbi:MAG: hypothetical protein QM571_05105 [Micrococcaceae bacterium]